MRKDIHPKYYNKAKVSCACGNAFEIGSTLEKIEIEVCSACHPFYTGSEKIIDTAGRVEKFKMRMAKAKPKQAKVKKVEKAVSDKKSEKGKSKTEVKVKS